MIITDVKMIHLQFAERAAVIRNSILPSRRPGATVIEVATDEGLVGHAITAGRAGFGGRDYVEGPLRTQVIGRNPFDTEHLWFLMMQGWRKPLTKGEVVSAVSGVDIAIWDLLGKATGKPVYQLLGGFSNEVPVYAAGGYYAEGKGHRGLVEEMKHYLTLGYQAVKMKVGGAPLGEDVARVAAVREAVGRDVKVMLDANSAWRAYEALEFLVNVREFEPYWIEEPVHPDDVEGCRRVRDHGGVPVATGENEYTRFGSHRLLSGNAVDFLQVDANIGGGVTEWRKIAALAGAYHVEMAPHGDHYTHLHLVAAIPNGRFVEVYPTIHSELHAVLGGPSVVEGRVRLPDRPGFGLDVNLEALAAYRLD